MASRHGIQCIIPPHMLAEIEKKGTPRQRDAATASVRAADEIRTMRQEVVKKAISPRAAAGKARAVHNANHGVLLPGEKVRGEGDPPSGDDAVDEAYDGSGDTYDFYQQEYGRNSLDGNGMELVSTVHYLQGFDNAFWNGQQMVYGDGDEDLPEDERLFNRFTIALDIIGHELSHGVIQFTANLAYQDQPGALNEHFADVFGVLVRQKKLNQTASEADWLMGKGLLTDNVNGEALRSMKAPGTAYDDPVLGKDPQPAHMNDFKDVDYDNGGVHINSGIPNHAFYVVAKELGGRAWEKAGLIWYRTLTDSRLSATSQFQACANLTYTIAGAEYGANSVEQQAVRTGWSAVGIDVEQQNGGNGKPGCLGSLAALGLLR